MDRFPRLLAALIAILPAACAPAAKESAEAPAQKRAATEKERPDLRAVPVPDIDPETGIDRNVTYEPQVGPEPEAPRPEKSPRSG